MIASRVGLLVVTAIAVLFGVLVVVDVAREPARPSRFLVGGLDSASITRLAWKRAGEPDVVIERMPAVDAKAPARWQWVAPVRGIAAEPAAVDAVLAALRGARWHRRDDVGQAGVARVTLAVTAGTRTVTLRVGAPLAGAGQTWIARDGRAYLVDDWVARALAPESLALRDVRPLRDAAVADAIVVERLPGETVRIEGTPPRMVKPYALAVEPARVAELEHALAALTIVATPPAAPAPLDAGLAMAITIVVPPAMTVELYGRGACGDGRVAIGGSAGPGCIAASDRDAIVRAFDALVRAEPSALVDRRPLPFEPIRIVLGDGTPIELAARPRVGDHDADPAAVAELLAVLMSPAAGVVASEPAVRPGTAITATDRGGVEVVLELLPQRRVRRRGEPVALELGAGAWTILQRPASAYRDPRLWVEDPLTIRSITIENIAKERTTYTRGAVVGEWSRSGPGKDDPAAASALAEQLAQPRVRARTVTAPAGAHTITFEVAPPTGATTTRTLRVSLAGCRASVEAGGGTDHVVLDPALCAALQRLR